MSFGNRATSSALKHRKIVVAVMATIAIVFPVLVALPSIWPASFPFLHGVDIDTDPENMLSENEAVRTFHDDMKRLFALNDIVVVGVVNEAHPNGVFNRETLRDIYTLTEYAKSLRGEVIDEDDPSAGVVEVDIIAPSTVDNIESGGLGVVKFEWLMSTPPETDEQALAVRDKALRLPFLSGTLVSEDGKAIALYLPLTSKDLSYKVYSHLKSKIDELEGAADYHIAGLPVAEDTFGVEMFKQMAISAPAAMLVIFILLFWFFRRWVLIISPMIIALVTVIFTMGMLVATGNTIHIMSSMIPIFIMPIAVLDSVHILSEFFDRYPKIGDRRKTILEVMNHLSKPMLFTSLTSTAGFASLALTPIPPVQVFGVFVALGVMAAWFFTITFIPAYVMFIPERAFADFGHAHHDESHTGPVLGAMKFATSRAPRIVLLCAAVLTAIAIYGINQIQINDNPTRWFKASHPIRVADRVLNEHFGGTYMGYLAFRAQNDTETVDTYAPDLRARLEEIAVAEQADTPEVQQVLADVLTTFDAVPTEFDSVDAYVAALTDAFQTQMDEVEGDLYYGWEAFSNAIDTERQRGEVFKDPAVLTYVEGLQNYLNGSELVGKSNALTDIVKTVHRELFEGDETAYRIPDSRNAVAQCLITFESSHRPHDLYHFVSPKYRETNVWIQLKSGDNKDMKAVVALADQYFAENPPPKGITHDWFGLTYINVVWQEKMVSGMLRAFAGSFLVVLLMMVVLFRSGTWGLLSMVPLTLTIGLIYGVIGLVGKDYDMPVAVLSSLTLGLAVDFAIHFLARAREAHAASGSWPATNTIMFGEPARAIMRNVVVIAVGFLPLLAATLVPYITVGVFLAAILLASGAATLVILPSTIAVAQSMLFPTTARMRRFSTAFTALVSIEAAVGLAALNIEEFSSWSAKTVWSSAGSVMVIAALLIMIATGVMTARTGSTAEMEDKS